MNRAASLDLGLLANNIRALLIGRTHLPDFETHFSSRSGPLYAELRKGGVQLSAGWAFQKSHFQSLAVLLPSLHKAAPAATDLLLCCGADMRAVPIKDRPGWLHVQSNAGRGLKGYALQFAENPSGIGFVAPFAMVAHNHTFPEVLQQYAQQRKLTVEQARAGSVHVAEFATEQFHIDLANANPPALPLCRCLPLVELSEIDRAYVENLERLLSDYLVRSVQRDGRAVYLFHPSQGVEDRTHNNAIRQWMATRILIRIWQRSGSEKLLPALRKNIDYNLAAMYREEGSLGLIIEGPKVKLGAVALAALALLESPFRAEFIEQQTKLLALVAHLWQESGEFRTFYRPDDRTDCQNFYPGEALLLWSTVIEQTGNAELIAKFWKSFEFYQAWHLANRNPAFIPWHTQAYCRIWNLTKDARFPPAVFLMNDWLLDVQQWDKAPAPDCRGRFFDPHRPFGPPHASSTAVYLEGLADAFALARALGDTLRADRYRATILRGLRSLAQLTFKDERDMFYIMDRDRLRGGVRTNEYDNAIRIDNVQHSLVALQKILGAFTPTDFVL